MTKDETVENNDEKKPEEGQTTDEKTAEETVKTTPPSDEGTEKGENVDKKEDEKEEENPYEAALKAVTDHNKDLVKENRQKTGALKEARKELDKKDNKPEEKSDEKPKEIGEVSEDDKPLTRSEAQKMLDNEKLEGMIERITIDDAERKLIRYHLANSIVRTGDNVKDLKAAYALANAHIVDQVKAQEAKVEGHENFMAGMTDNIAVSSKKGKEPYETNPVLIKAAQNLKKMGASGAVKYLNKQAKK